MASCAGSHVDTRAMKIAGLTMVTNPAYRQDPWREHVRQMLLCFDVAIVVVGREDDKQLFTEAYFSADELKRLHVEYLYWPQPEWSYEELARHLNVGMKIARLLEMDWVIKLDVDTFVHERDRGHLRTKLFMFKENDVIAATFEKYQFFKVDRAYEKGKVPLAINLDHNVWYGYNKEKYTDLCQPILKESEVSVVAIGGHAVSFDIPSGRAIHEKRIQPTGVHVWNYDYSFKTQERMLELLYHFDRSHAKFWGRGYSGRSIEDITIESAMQDYVNLVTGRVKKCVHMMPAEEHPVMIRQRVAGIEPHEWGHSFFGLVPVSNPTKDFNR